MERLLEGLKVVDFSWVIVGPQVTKFLADHGATVVRVESNKRVDGFRYYQPVQPGPGINRGGPWASMNAGKYGMSLNMQDPKGLEVGKRLVAWCDVLVENFTPGTIAKWGLGYDVVKAINPRAIMFSMSSLGQTGPMANVHGSGYHLFSFGGFSSVLGFSDRDPIGPIPYSDFVAPPFGVSAIMGALDRRHRTGKGMHFDMSQMEASLHFLGPVILDYSANGRDARRDGNASPNAAPHNAYRCKDGRWCAMAVTSDAQWQAFREVIGTPAWAMDPALEALAGRLQALPNLDEEVGAWTSTRVPEDVVRALLEAGVPAAVVQDGPALAKDPQLLHRGYFQEFEHQDMGRSYTHLVPVRYSGADTSVIKGAPTLGEDTEYVCTQILGMSDEEWVALVEEDVLI